MRIDTQAILPIIIFGRPFTFLDIGCSSPEESCCYPLIELECEGHFIDVNHFDGWDGLNFHQIDATKTDWNFVKEAEFIQIDVEGIGKRFEVLKSIPLDRLDTKIISIEHDGYRTKHNKFDFDSAERNPQREYLKLKGYKILYKDVSNQNGEAYEDWWIRNDLWEQNKSLYCENANDAEIYINLNETWEENTYQH